MAAQPLVDAAAAAVGAAPCAIDSFSRVDDADWVSISQAQFPPTRISDRLWIVPSWCDAPDPAAIVVRLDPGVAFGTGTHPTTRLCLTWLDRHLGPGDRVLDYGCGSGILAIAAGRLGAATLVGVDIDEQALSAARANSAANGVSARYTDPAGLGTAQFDIVVANILSNPLKLLAPALLARVAPAGALVLSGVLERQAAEVIAAYREARSGVALAVTEVCDGWVCLSGWRMRDAAVHTPMNGLQASLLPGPRGTEIMALATKCPQCGAMFRVVADQLKLRGGLVRCGQCRTVFDAIGSLAYVEDGTLARISPGAEAASSAPVERDGPRPTAEAPVAESQARRARHHARERVERKQRKALGPATTLRIAPGSAPVATVSLPLSPTTGDARPRARPTIDLRDMADAGGVPTLLAPDFSTRPGEASARAPLQGIEVVEMAPLADAPMATDSLLDEPEFVRASATRPRRGFSIVFTGGSLLLALLAAAQLAVIYPGRSFELPGRQRGRCCCTSATSSAAHSGGRRNRISSP